MEAAPRRLEARDYWRIINKRKWLIISIGTVTMLIGGIYAASYSPTYRATAEVWIRREAPKFFWATGKRSSASEDASLETQAALARSSDNVAKTAQRLAARTSGGPIIVTAAQILDSTTIRVAPPDRILIEAVYPRRDYAIAFANETARTFVETSADFRRSEDQAAVEFLEDQLKVSQQELNQALTEKRQLQKKWGVSSPEASQRLLVIAEQYKTALAAAQADLVATNGKIARLRQKYAAAADTSKTEPDIALNPLRISLQQELHTTRLALIKLRARYTSDHPAIQQLEALAQELSAQLEREPATIKIASVVGPERREHLRAQLEAAELQVADLQGRVGVLQDLISSAETESLDLIEKEGALVQLEDKAQLARSTFEGLLEGLRDNRLKVAAKQGTAQILSHAIRAQEIKPSIARALIFSGLLGLLAGIMVSLLLEALDVTIRSPDDILRDTEVAFLGMVPWIEPEAEELPTLVTPKSPAAEAFRTLRSNINFALVDQPARSFLIASAGAGEGKSIVAANLAVVFAQAGQSVLLVDTDLRRPTLHRFLNADSSQGLTNVLVGELPIQDALQETDVENLKIITSGPLPPNPAELLDSASMGSVIQQLSQQADIIIYDSPPAIMLTDAVVLSSKIERTILVAEAGQVSRDAFNEAVRLITHARGTILGAVLNKVKVTAGDYYYYYYYYDYASRTGEEQQTPAAQSPILPLNSDDSDTDG